jgi:hypothetical protein
MQVAQNDMRVLMFGIVAQADAIPGADWRMVMSDEQC